MYGSLEAWIPEASQTLAVLDYVNSNMLHIVRFRVRV